MHRLLTSLLVFTALVAASLAQLGAEIKLPKLEAMKPRPNFVIGRVVDMAGKPLAGVKVRIFGTTEKGDNTRFETETDAKGQFSQRVPAGFYGVEVDHYPTFNDKLVKFSNLDPLDGVRGRRYDSTEGVVRDFVWKINGRRSNVRLTDSVKPENFHGGVFELYVTPNLENSTFPDGGVMEVTLKPIGNLVDGTKGQELTFQGKIDGNPQNPYLRFDRYVYDIPIGNYEISARIVLPSGEVRPLRVGGEFEEAKLGGSHRVVFRQGESFGEPSGIWEYTRVYVGF
jgi:hypothetical protein